ncbi:MAG: hypothetical protein AB9907_18735 [Flexilinea sp.]
MEKTSSYILEIYEPDSRFCNSRFQQETPYPRISKGDILRFYDTSEIVGVSKVEHSIWETERVFTFQTLIWTTKLLP